MHFTAWIGSPLVSGKKYLVLKFSSRSFQWSFCLAPVTTPILGSDFLRNFSLLGDVAGGRATSPEVRSQGDQEVVG